MNLLGSNGEGFSQFRGWLLDRIAEHAPKLIVYEEPIIIHYGPRKTSLQTAMWLMGLAAHVVEVAHLRGIRCEPANVIKIKRFMTDDGRAKKPAMIAAIEQCGWKTETSDEADALSVLLWAEVRFAPKYRRSIAALGPLFREIENAVVPEPRRKTGLLRAAKKGKGRKPRPGHGVARLPAL